MALQKEIISDNGVPTNYHRIVSVQSITNWTTDIEVCSYINENERQKELAYQELQKKSIDDDITDEEKESLEIGINIFTNTTRFTLAYDKNMNVDNAYTFLKTTEMFENSEDV